MMYRIHCRTQNFSKPPKKSPESFPEIGTFPLHTSETHASFINPQDFQRKFRTSCQQQQQPRPECRETQKHCFPPKRKEEFGEIPAIPQVTESQASYQNPYEPRKLSLGYPDSTTSHFVRFSNKSLLNVPTNKEFSSSIVSPPKNQDNSKQIDSSKKHQGNSLDDPETNSSNNSSLNIQSNIQLRNDQFNKNSRPWGTSETTFIQNMKSLGKRDNIGNTRSVQLTRYPSRQINKKVGHDLNNDKNSNSENWNESVDHQKTNWNKQSGDNRENRSKNHSNIRENSERRRLSDPRIQRLSVTAVSSKNCRVNSIQSRNSMPTQRLAKTSLTSNKSNICSRGSVCLNPREELDSYLDNGIGDGLPFLRDGIRSRTSAMQRVRQKLKPMNKGMLKQEQYPFGAKIMLFCTKGIMSVPSPSDVIPNINSFCQPKDLITFHKSMVLDSLDKRRHRFVVNMNGFLDEDLYFFLDKARGKLIIEGRRPKRENINARRLLETIDLLGGLDPDNLRIARDYKGQLLFEEAWIF